MGRIDPTDAELVVAARRGERDAFARLVERYQGIVCAVSYSSTGDRALSEDVTQETFLAAWRQLGELHEIERLRAWLCGIARNLARKARRRSARETLVDEPPAVAADGRAFEAASEAQADAMVREALATVPETYREALVLYYHEGRSAKQVAAALGITEAAVLKRLIRGRRHLADSVSDLVERSLAAGRAPRRSLALAVVGALPDAPAPPSQVAPNPDLYQGATMWKTVPVVAAAAAAAIVIGGVAFAVRGTGSTGSRADGVSSGAAPAAGELAPRARMAPALPALAGSSSPASLPSPDRARAAERAQRAGRAAAGRDVADPCASLLDSLTLDLEFDTAFALAECYEAAGKLLKAQHAFYDAAKIAASEGGTEQVKTARTRAEALSPRLARLTFINLPDQLPGQLAITLDDDPIQPPALRRGLTIDPGSHVLAYNVAGAARQLRIEATAGRTAQVALDLPAGPPSDAVDRGKLERLGVYRGITHGDPTAATTLVAFVDSTCDGCSKLPLMLQRLVTAHRSGLRVIVKQAPSQLAIAGEAAFAADAQGKLWAFHEQLIAQRGELTREVLVAAAGRAGLDVAAFRDALDRHVHAQAVAADQAQGRELGITGAPAFLLDGQRYDQLDELHDALASKLARR